MKRILWIEDEPDHMVRYLASLRGCGFCVKMLRNEAQVKEEIRDQADFDLLIWDLFMPSKNPHLEDGVRYGLHLYEIFRRCNPTVSAVLFTNANDRELFGRLEADDLKLVVARKRHYDPKQFLALVQSLLKD